ncbi:MAG: hypothetical protein A3I11_04810 [Elusimicrobia bacterium RIFCSPLOWO2_02_FULL_39_32]|nr:MAG: hypothetical protein A2034_06775 [Elusimicrobia bacterium GWA2_38_7]OGR80124.1 MAG: hypothetical protein A3B80_00795 [Elusimicrobia bacterium RIFCSPHIGHO2_02_FULL_39_36]OGR91081.1 MAG: hypothetical protein A3I11_04810 [Elusimicrobia bacterium RIFCSPLOWO2_02_FULL_39_32]OGS00048.1 MAG: hypothetical protein A3G85_07775 [Elusimicrobia bacterium RIFCSPLOWO2_12_FULL_39_28]
MSNFFKNKVVIITGASSGIGLATARLLYQNGAKCVLAARRKGLLEKIAKELNGSLPIETDVTKKDSLENLVKETLKVFGRIDILINNAGILIYKPIEQCSEEELREVMEVNYFGAVGCVNAILPIMKKQGSGAIANVASIAGKLGFPSLGYYAASKFALVGYSQALRQEIKQYGIFVSAIYPGTVYTPMTEEIIEGAKKKGKNVLPISAEKVAEKILVAIEKKKSEVFVPRATHFLYFLHFFFPKFTEWLAWKFRASDPNDFKA